MRYTEAMVAWTPADKYSEDDPRRGKIVVVPWPDRDHLADGYRRTVGACFADTHKLDQTQLVAQVFIDFNCIVVRDRIDPQLAHNAFLVIDEYAERIPEDQQGAREPRDGW